MTPTYLLHGLHVRSELPIDASTVDSSEADVEIRWGERRRIGHVAPDGDLLASTARPDRGSSLTADECGYTLRFHRLCDIELDPELRTVVVHLTPDAEEEFASLLVSSALATLLVLRRECVLHASAVEVATGAVAFVGGSGMGKSTIAALCCASGARIVTDDMLRIELLDEAPWCYSGTSRLRLRQQAAELAKLIDARGSRSTVDYRIGVCPSATDRGRLPLTAIVAPLAADGGQEIEIVRLRGPSALLELAKHPGTVGWTMPDPAVRDLHVLAQTAQLVPISCARLPWGPPFQEEWGIRLLDELDCRPT